VLQIVKTPVNLKNLVKNFTAGPLLLFRATDQKTSVFAAAFSKKAAVFKFLNPCF